MFPSTMSWTATEEIRRTWWGVITLDRQYQWYIEETGKVELKAAVDSLKGALALIGNSWKVGEKYCRILEGERV
ncbi:hypothetical protein CEP54_012903 [Fusarium duplospermum]|uniref:Transcription factor domain-containing protein n=1 Tax=Fusarium duplospermum TaxID=1325734 RepID=A0A428P618_9HYPO|nr:hypothetical protein CEP54_012903 [Fusarium duplospermum]